MLPGMTAGDDEGRSRTQGANREAILRRRAFFVTSAIGALGCSPEQSSRPPPTTAAPTANEVQVPATPEPTASVDSDAPAPPPRATPDAGAMPSLDVPPGVSEVAQGHYEDLARDVPRLHNELDGLEKLVPDACAIGEARCDAAWRKLADGLWQFQRELWRLGPRCGGSSEDAKAFGERLQAHRQHLEKRRDDIVARVQGQLAESSDKQRWDKHQLEARKAAPQPCLKYACPEW